MKTINRKVAPAALLFFALFVIGLVVASHAQSDSQAVANQTLQPVAPDSIPAGAAFFKMSDYIANGGTLGGPYPYMPDTNAPMYSLYGNTFLVDDAVVTNDDELANVLSLLVQPQDQFSANLMGGGAMTMDAADINPADYTNSPDGGDGGTNSYTPAIVTYPTNVLWIEVPTNSLAASNQFLAVLHNTIGDAPYDVLTSTNLALPLSQWTVEQSVIGVEGTNCTPVTLLINNRSNLFVDARFGGSSDDSGLPDWWDLEYFGTNGVDPFADDPSGDGWTYLDDFRKGFVPGTWHTPKPPQNLAWHFDATGANVVLTWLSGGGNVDHFEIDDGLDGGFFTEIGEVNGDTLTFTTAAGPITNSSFSADDLEVTAVFANGDRSTSAYVSAGQLISLDRDCRIVRGANGRFYLTIPNIPKDLSRVHVFWPSFGGDPVLWLDIDSSNIVNGTVEMPDDANQSILSLGYPTVQLVDEQGHYSENIGTFDVSDERDYVGLPPTVNFVNASVHMKENLRFLLRAAGVFWPFGYSSGLSYSTGSYHQDYPVGADADHPELSLARGTASTNYEYYGFHTFSPNLGYSFINELRLVQENFLWRNFIYNQIDYTNAPGNGYPEFDTANAAENTGVNWKAGINNLGFQDSVLWPTINFAKYQYTGTGSEAPLPLAFDSTNSDWIFHPESSDASPHDNLGIYWDGSEYALGTGVKNIYGLSLDSAYADLNFAAAGAAMPFGSWVFEHYATTDLQTVDYYFGSQTPFFNYIFPYSYTWPSPVLPGGTNFSTTNTSPLLITGIGQPMTVSGWAKMAIANGDTNKFAYLEQYFDHAYSIDTTNSPGLLSPYGDFFPTVPGPAALVTMPDTDTGERGTGVVNVIKLQLDVNHDGNMDLSFGGPDNTSPARPFTFWLNNDDDGVGIGNEIDFGTNSVLADCFQGKIRSQRNLEDFARLWLCGLPLLPPSAGYRLTLSMDSEGFQATNGEEPVINIYPEFQPGGTGYLTDTNAAALQLSQVRFEDILIRDYNQALGPIGQGSEYTLPLSADGSLVLTNFLFEGVQPGKGRLVLTVWQNTNVVAQTAQWLDLHDIKDLYEQATVTNVQRYWPDMVLSDPTSEFKVLSPLQPDSSQNNQLAVFVHGWRMPVSTWYEFAETMFKRLYWQGYQGGFASIFWPTRSADTDGHFLDFITYNRSEHIAFKSGSGTAAYLNDLRQRFLDYAIGVCSHSMGGIVMMETLKELAAANQKPIDNYVMMQAAVPAQCYDPSITNLQDFLDLEQSIPTPNTYSNYAAGITNALRDGGKIINFFNPLDFALNTWVLNQLFEVPYTNGPATIKPNSYFGYSTDGMNSILRTNEWNQSLDAVVLGYYYDGPTRTIIDPHEIMPFVSRPRSLAVGGQDGVHGTVSIELNLETQFGFTDEPYDHSGQFNRNIQDSVVWPFYSQLKTNLFLK